MFKKILIKKSKLIFLLSLFFSITLIGCQKKEKIFFGTYINENNSNQEIIISEEYISFKNLDFTSFNSEILESIGINADLNNLFNGENNKHRYLFVDNQIKIEVLNIASIIFDVIDEKIIVNKEKFIYKNQSWLK